MRRVSSKAATPRRCSAGRCTPMRAACCRPCRGSTGDAAPSSPPSTARRPICWRRRRAAGSVRAAGSPSTSARRCRRWRRSSRGHLAACFRKHIMEALDPPAARADELAEGGIVGRRHADPRHSRGQQVLPRARRLPAPAQAGACGQRRHARRQARRDAGAGGRVRLRQVHARPAGAAARRPDRRRDPLRGHRHRAASSATR